MSLLISLTDIGVQSLPHAHALWSHCLGRGVRPALMLALPEPRHSAELPSPLVDWLLARVEQGGRVLLDGAQSAGDLTPRWLDDRVRWLRARGLRPLGVHVRARGGRSELRRAAAEAGLPLMEDARFIWRLRDETPISAPILRVDHAAAGARVIRESTRLRTPWSGAVVRIHLSASTRAADGARETMVAALDRLLAARPATSHAVLARGDGAAAGRRSAA